MKQLNNFMLIVVQARQCFPVRGGYPLMGSTDEAETGGLTKEEYMG